MMQEKTAGPRNEGDSLRARMMTITSLSMGASIRRACGITRLLRECMEDGE